MFSSMAAGPVAGITVPGGVTALTAVGGDGQVRLAWEAPDSEGRAVVDHYVVFQNGVEVAHCGSTSIVISGLTNGESYRFMVAARSSAGMGPLTTPCEATPRAAVNPLSAIAPAATVMAVAAVIAREATEGVLRVPASQGPAARSPVSDASHGDSPPPGPAAGVDCQSFIPDAVKK